MILLNDDMREPHELPLLPLLNVSERLDLFKIIKDELSHPTIDDAIKVVEEMKIEKCSQFNNDVYHFDYIFEEILTALRGLKERE